jgi:hypothetical protein
MQPDTSDLALELPFSKTENETGMRSLSLLENYVSDIKEEWQRASVRGWAGVPGLQSVVSLTSLRGPAPAVRVKEGSQKSGNLDFRDSACQ